MISYRSWCAGYILTLQGAVNDLIAQAEKNRATLNPTI